MICITRCRVALTTLSPSACLTCSTNTVWALEERSFMAVEANFLRTLQTERGREREKVWGRVKKVEGG
jgi:hypothetical protein